MNANQNIATARDGVRLWLCRALLQLTRWAYEPYAIEVIVRRADEIKGYD